jgi:hypothetical protein
MTPIDPNSASKLYNTRMPLRTILSGVAVSFLLFLSFVSAPGASASGIPARAVAQNESPSGWVEVRSPHFIIVSNASEDQAEKTAGHFEEIRAVFRTALPFASTHESPVITVLALRDEASMQQLLPDFWEKNHVRNAGLFVQRLGKAYIVLRLDLVTDNTYETIYHEYFHSITTPYYPYLPLWLSEGLAEFFGNAEINAKDVTLGRVNASLLRQLNGKTLIALPTLFRVDHASQYYNEQARTSLFYAESWALVHYLLVGDDVSRHSAIANYLKALQNQVPPDKAAQQAFGDLNVLARELVRYVGSAYFREVRMKSAPEFEAAGYKSRPLGEAESAAIRANFQVYRSRPALAGPLVEEALRLGPNLALAHETRGVMEYLDGHRPAALAEINRAVAIDPQNYLTHFLRATLLEEDEGAYQPTTPWNPICAAPSNSIPTTPAPTAFWLPTWPDKRKTCPRRSASRRRLPIWNREPGSTSTIWRKCFCASIGPPTRSRRAIARSRKPLGRKTANAPSALWRRCAAITMRSRRAAPGTQSVRIERRSAG